MGIAAMVSNWFPAGVPSLTEGIEKMTGQEYWNEYKNEHSFFEGRFHEKAG